MVKLPSVIGSWKLLSLNGGEGQEREFELQGSFEQPGHNS